jgi:ankyrin repeat protein
MLASYYGHAPLVKLLLEHGADPNTLNDRGQSPLAGAVFKGETEVVEVSIA